jgi:hypothetical protein
VRLGTVVADYGVKDSIAYGIEHDDPMKPKADPDKEVLE